MEHIGHEEGVLGRNHLNSISLFLLSQAQISLRIQNYLSVLIFNRKHGNRLHLFTLVSKDCKGSCHFNGAHGTGSQCQAQIGVEASGRKLLLWNSQQGGSSVNGCIVTNCLEYFYRNDVHRGGQGIPQLHISLPNSAEVCRNIGLTISILEYRGSV